MDQLIAPLLQVEQH